MQRSLAGDAAAHRELLTLLAPPLRAYFRGRTRGNAADAEDLVQETLLAIHLKRETFDVNAPVTVWAFAIARHKLCDWDRQSSKRAQSQGIAAEVFVDDDKENATAGDDVARLLDGLSGKQATAIRCMKLEGLTAAETAARTGQSVAAVKVDVHRGLRKLVSRIRQLLA